MKNRRQTIILASRSPRRKELLKTIGIPFKSVPADISETVCGTPEETVLTNARQKALAVCLQYPDQLVIGVDTIVYLDRKVLGKPADLREAVKFLKLLNGRKHLVFSGIAMVRKGRILSGTERTEVFFDRLSHDELENYARHCSPLDKAGAYGIQEFSSMYIKAVRGDYFNVVGLPLNLLYRLMKKAGYHFFRQKPPKAANRSARNG
jgi:septum formation protein